jgi:hypothetical protein
MKLSIDAFGPSDDIVTPLTTPTLRDIDDLISTLRFISSEALPYYMPNRGMINMQHASTIWGSLSSNVPIDRRSVSVNNTQFVDSDDYLISSRRMQPLIPMSYQITPRMEIGEIGIPMTRQIPDNKEIIDLT